MTDNMIATQNGASPAKIYLYSGHESNIAALLKAFQVYEPHVPEYSSAIFIELQKINSEFYVKVSSNVRCSQTVPYLNTTLTR